MLRLGAKLYAPLKAFPSSGIYKVVFNSTFQDSMLWGFLLPFSSGNGNEYRGRNHPPWTWPLNELHGTSNSLLELDSMITTIQVMYHGDMAYLYPMYILKNPSSQSIVSSV